MKILSRSERTRVLFESRGGLGQVSEVREDAKLPSKIDIKLRAAMSSRSRYRARWVDVCW